jgi:ABC-type polysaccharide/polyol phosphate export permease
VVTSRTSLWTEYKSARELTVNLTLRELKGKYKRSVLGWTWSLLNPLATIAIFALVFRFFLKIQAPVGDPSGAHNFALFLVAALLPWNYLNNGLNGSMGALVGNANLVKKVYFPREALVVANVASWAYSLLIEFAVAAVVYLAFGNMVLPWLPAVLVLIAIQSLMVLGLGLLLSVLNVYFRDVQHLINILLLVWFYATPIVYPPSYVVDANAKHPELFGHAIPVLFLYRLNPMARLVGAYRNVLYDLKFPSMFDVAYVTAFGLLTLAFGLWSFRRLQGRVAEEL